MYRMECVEIEAFISGEIDCDDLRDKLLHNKDKPAILCLTLGTSLKGAVDDVDKVIRTLEECGFQEDKFYIHLDGATYGLMLPLLKGVAPKISFKKPIGSISVSAHKFIGCPMPCGIQMARKRHIHVLSKDVEYMKTRDCLITCSRNGHIPIYLWYALNRKGYRGFEQDVKKCLRNAKYLKDLLKAASVSVMLNKTSYIMAMERPPDDDFILRWQLPCVGDIARVVVMPSDTLQKLDNFYHQLLKSRSIYYKSGAKQPPCVAPQIGIDNCACSKHN